MKNYENSEAFDFYQMISRVDMAIEAGLLPNVDLILEAAAAEVDPDVYKVEDELDFPGVF